MYLNWFVGFSVQFPHDWVRHLSPIWNESELRSDEHYMSSSENKTWKKKELRPLRDLNPWPLRYLHSAPPTVLTCQLELVTILVPKNAWIGEKMTVNIQKKICELRMKSGMKAIFAIMHRRSQICRKQFAQLICWASPDGNIKKTLKTKKKNDRWRANKNPLEKKPLEVKRRNENNREKIMGKMK